MDFFLENTEALILLVVMIIGGLKWVIEQAKGVQGQDEDDETFEDLYEEARREILERQGGYGQSSEPPVSSIPQVEVVAPPPPAPPPLPSAAPPPTPTPYRASSPPPPVRPSLSPAELRALQRVQKRAATPIKVRKRPTSRVRSLLSTPSAARDAIVLREILGPPKGAS